MHHNFRDDRKELEDYSLSRKILFGIALYCPFSSIKKSIYTMQGAKIGQGTFFGYGSLLISGDYSKIVIGNDVVIAPGSLIKVDSIEIGDQTNIGYQDLIIGGSLTIGKRCNINNRVFIEASFAPVIVEDDVTIAASAIISSHDGAYSQTRNQEMKTGKIELKDHCFIGNNAIVMPGITIGERAIVGAGAVVTKCVNKDDTVVGVPARILKNKDYPNVQ